MTTPPPKIVPAVLFVCGINFVGITREIGKVVTGNNFGRDNFHGLTGK